MAGVADIVLQIGSSFGPGGLASLKAGWDMLSGMASTVIEVTKELDKFKVVMGRVDMEMVNYADSAAQGLIDTLKLAESLNKLNETGAKVTREEFKILAVRAVELAKATGDDATKAFERLTDGISKGSTRAIAEYGEKIKVSSNLQETQRKMVEKLTDGYEDLTTSVDTASEAVYGLGNSWGTVKGDIWSAMTGQDGVFTVITLLKGILDDIHNSFIVFNKETYDYLFSLYGIIDKFRLGLAAIVDFMSQLTGGVAITAPAVLAEMRNRLEAENIYGPANKTEPTEQAPKKAAVKSGGGKEKFVTEGEDVEALARLADPEYAQNVQIFAEVMGRVFDDIESILKVEEEFRKGPAVLGYGGPPVLGGRSFEGVSQSVDERMASADAELKIVEAHERRLQLVTDEFEIVRQIKEINDEELIQMKESSVQRRARLELIFSEEYQEASLKELREEELIQMQESAVQRRARLELITSEEYQEARLQELREEEQVHQAERQIELEFAREQAIDFAQQFGDVWAAAMDRISAGGMAADGVLNIMRGTWGAIVTAAIEGHNGIGQAIRETIKAVGIQIAIEAGLMALLSAGRAIYYAATRQYASATKAGLAAASFAATAVVAGVAAATASAFGKSAKSIKTVSIPSSSSASSSVSSYGGAYSGEQTMQQEVIIRLAPDAGSQMFEVVQQQNTMARRSGTTSFSTEAA
jgi:hypothetical protein